MFDVITGEDGLLLGFAFHHRKFKRSYKNKKRTYKLFQIKELALEPAKEVGKEWEIMELQSLAQAERREKLLFHSPNKWNMTKHLQGNECEQQLESVANISSLLVYSSGLAFHGLCHRRLPLLLNPMS